jgi:tripartite-type tricarboxylate transporter receptor subunit TctC
MIITKISISRARFFIAIGLIALQSLVTLQAQTKVSYPTKPVTLVVPAAAGGGLDVAMRHFAKRLSEEMAFPVVTENRPGVNLLIGTRFVANAAPDGYTMLAMSNTFIGATVFGDAPGYDPFKDFIAISSVAQGANLLLVPTSSGIQTAAELVDRAKKAGANKLSFGSAGFGSSPHVAAQLFSKSTATSYIDVPYKGTAPAMIDLLGGRLTFMFDSITAAMPHIKAGTLRALAVTTAKRTSVMPNVPTMNEALSLTDYNLPLFYGIAVPAKTSPEVVKALQTAIGKAVLDPALKDQFSTMGFELMGSENPDEYSRFLKQQLDKLLSLKL